MILKNKQTNKQTDKENKQPNIQVLLADPPEAEQKWVSNGEEVPVFYKLEQSIRQYLCCNGEQLIYLDLFAPTSFNF